MTDQKRPQIVAGPDGDALEATLDAQTAISWDKQKGWYDLAAQIAKNDRDEEDVDDNR
ncbi:hypothetical protein [Heliorestis convoluta]|uniref:Uncharacterized protein n=1 Tax=Heliorestis convoluta TaxID=356322 RepID=A0A5Q2MYR8_9FIRM|nr:hypothetical protein [Heliorestis convoluta]QGG48094.1 hypothetical protein FTV88_1996 [Heliorestis convoluta]